MEHLAPSLQYLNDFLFEIENGYSVKDSLIRLNNRNLAFSKRVNQYLFMKQAENLEINVNNANTYQQMLLEIIFKGVVGEPVLRPLKVLQEEMIEKSKEDIDMHLAKIPFQLMLPLLIFQFPAYLILLFVPILKSFLSGLIG